MINSLNDMWIFSIIEFFLTSCDLWRSLIVVLYTRTVRKKSDHVVQFYIVIIFQHWKNIVVNLLIEIKMFEWLYLTYNQQILVCLIRFHSYWNGRLRWYTTCLVLYFVLGWVGLGCVVFRYLYRRITDYLSISFQHLHLHLHELCVLFFTLKEIQSALNET